MTSQSALELLLPELQRRILSQTDSFESLYSLIRASPRLYQVFRLNKQITLSNLACRQFDPATIRAALGIEKLRQIEHPPFSRDTVLQFFNLEYDEPTDFPQPILPLPVSTNLRKLDGTIRFLTNDYVQNTLPIVTQLSSSEHPAIRTEYKRDCGVPRPTISRSESFRLRRAFCRFETYRQLFSRCSLDINHDLQRCPSDPSLTVFEQAEKFFQHMPAHQAAEVACVRDYLHRRLRGVFDQVEDEVVQELQEECPNPMDRRQALEWAYYDTGGRLQDVAEDMHYFGYLGKIDQRHHIEHLTSLGLPYVRRLLESSGDERRNLLLRTGAGCYKQEDRDFVSAALGVDSFSGQRKMYRWRGRNIKSCLDERTKLDLPPGWLWAHKDNDYHSVVDLYAKGLRDWGYVFWDLERLQTAGVLDLDPHSVARTKFNDHFANDRPSVQERWLGPHSLLSDDEEEEEGMEGEAGEGPEQDEVEGGHEGQSGGQEEEDTQDKDTSHWPSKGISWILKWIRYHWHKWWKPCVAKWTARI